MNINVLDFFKFASRMPQIAQTWKICRECMPPDPPTNFLFFFPWAIPGSDSQLYSQQVRWVSNVWQTWGHGNRYKILMIALKGAIQDFYNILTTSWTVSNMYTQVARAWSWYPGHFEHICWRLNCGLVWHVLLSLDVEVGYLSTLWERGQEACRILLGAVCVKRWLAVLFCLCVVVLFFVCLFVFSPWSFSVPFGKCLSSMTNVTCQWWALFDRNCRHNVLFDTCRQSLFWGK